MRRRKSTFYSRANSYSRSYNATVAESEGKLPLTRAAKELRLSQKAFKIGIFISGHHACEWHHVGKYARQVDYYDVPTINDDVNFWIAAMNKANKATCQEHIERIEKLLLTNKN
jgi:hypothetical protein